jgi:hypothetical protein
MKKFKFITLVVLLYSFSLGAGEVVSKSSEVEHVIKTTLNYKLSGTGYELTKPCVKVSFTKNPFKGAKNMIGYIVDSKNPYITREVFLYIAKKSNNDVYSYHCNVDFDQNIFVVYNCGIYLNGYPCLRGSLCPEAPFLGYKDSIYKDKIFDGEMK